MLHITQNLLVTSCVVYVLKFVLRAESPRDYVDVLLSMKFQPNICIIDMAHMVVAHGNKRKPNMFSPNDGMVSEISEENIEKALLGTLSVSLPWLEKENASTTSVIDDVHPVAGSSTHLCLFDRLHERNTVKEKKS